MSKKFLTLVLVVLVSGVIATYPVVASPRPADPFDVAEYVNN